MKLFLIFLVYTLALSLALWRRGLSSRSGAMKTGPGGTPTRLLIVGATGGTGRQLVGQALDRGHEVTALARNPDALAIQHPRLQVVRGDVLDFQSVDAAVRGQDAVLSALGHRRYFGPTRILSDGTLNLLRAMETHGVRRFVCETSLGIGDTAGRMGLYYTLFVIPVVLPFYFWDKARQERIIAESRASWVIVRPGALLNGAKRGLRRHGRGAGSFLWTVGITRADVAEFMLNQLTDNTYLGAAPGVV
jgi:uncharacterized protein YbjT (DUF2867 family)